MGTTSLLGGKAKILYTHNVKSQYLALNLDWLYTSRVMSDSIQQIKDRLNILDVVSPYVELHKAGKNFKGRSPFSAEKTPSFYVSPDRGMYYCFSTSQGGDIFNFIQAMEGVDFKEALKILAQKAGVELVPEDPQKKTERERLYSALEAATFFYQQQLPKTPEAVSYLERRGVSKETISKWRIGYAPGPPFGGWREVKTYLEEKKYSADELIKAGLIKTAQGGKEPFDVFRDRIMFPMSEQSGKVVAFSGRILNKDSDAPKYVNSPETQLYKKSELLFGYDKAKQGIRHLDFSLIVEGQFDVVMCHQAGYNNTVAVSGTALTLNHVQLLERLSNKVVLALDADRAGISAMKKAANVMLRRGLDVKVAELPLGMDPADIIQKNKTDFKKYIGDSVHVIEFMLHVLRREITDDRSFKLKTREEILPFILLLPSRIDQEHFVDLVSKTIGTTTDAVRYEIERLREQAGSKADYQEVPMAKSVVSEQSNSAGQLSRLYLFLLAATKLLDESFGKKLEAELDLLHVDDKVINWTDSDMAGTVFTLEQQFAKLPPQSVTEEVVSRLNQFRASLLRSRVAKLRQALSQTESSGEADKSVALLTEISTLEVSLRESAYSPEFFTTKEG